MKVSHLNNIQSDISGSSSCLILWLGPTWFMGCHYNQALGSCFYGSRYCICGKICWIKWPYKAFISNYYTELHLEKETKLISEPKLYVSNQWHGENDPVQPTWLLVQTTDQYSHFRNMLAKKKKNIIAECQLWKSLV